MENGHSEAKSEHTPVYDIFSAWRKIPGIGALAGLVGGPFGLIYIDGGVGCCLTVLYLLASSALYRPTVSIFGYTTRGSMQSLFEIGIRFACAVAGYYLSNRKNNDLDKAIDKAIAKVKVQSRYQTLLETGAASSRATIVEDETPFGILPDGRDARLFTLSNALGITVKITNYGGRIISIRTPDRNGVVDEIGLGFDSLEKYIQTGGIHGAVVNNVAGRSTGGASESEPQPDVVGLRKEANRIGLSYALWNAKIENDRLRLDYSSSDGAEGHRNDSTVTVWYSLEGQDLRIEYEATADRPTYVNLSNRIYFNLDSFRTAVFDHCFRIQADKYIPLDAARLPLGELKPVSDTPFDFNAPSSLYEEFSSKEFVDLYFVLKKRELFDWLAEVSCGVTGRTMAMATTEPCLRLCIDDSVQPADSDVHGKTYSAFDAFSLEAQRYPESVRLDDITANVPETGSIYRQTTVYRFGIDWTAQRKAKKISEQLIDPRPTFLRERQ